MYNKTLYHIRRGAVTTYRIYIITSPQELRCQTFIVLPTRDHFALIYSTTVKGQSRDRIPVVVRFSAPVQTGPGAQPASCTVGTGSFPGVKSSQDVMLTPHPHLVSQSRKRRAIPQLPHGPYSLYKGGLLLYNRKTFSYGMCGELHYHF